jgi:hypothetical protein
MVRDHNGQALAYVYYEEEPGRRSAAKLLTGAADRGEHCCRSCFVRPSRRSFRFLLLGLSLLCQLEHCQAAGATKAHESADGQTISRGALEPIDGVNCRQWK